ncbi:MAG TPA: ATP-binding cassette domain-containing protein [Steroidobacteraceae bacterium]|nr:ATP-binding cassette domain-containing protein [Steroidobacteraceae bacterium]
MSITLDQLTKRYQGVPVVNDVSLEIGDGEFFVLLGPSGSGKSTLLRAIAGLSGLDHGRIALHGRDVTHVSARRRGVGLVFQNYALFRHMTVAENIEFALRVRRMRAAQRRSRRQELLRLVALEGMDERLPGQLSGGQQQRVAVARALAHKPEVLLLDEPFGALDAKIREGLRRTIREVQRELGITTILVTHDQEEAFAMADRIGVMNFGRLLECGRPQDLYTHPATRFVATFLGAANLILARQSADGPRWGAWPPAMAGAGPGAAAREREVVAVVRPEEIQMARSRDELSSSAYLGRGVVEEVLFTGALERARIRLDEAPEAPILAHANGEGAVLLEATRAQFEQRAFTLTPGQSVTVGVRRAHVLATPLSSFTVCASNGSAVARLAGHPLLLDLSSRMKTRIRRHVEPLLGDATPIRDAATSLPGTSVIAAHENVVSDANWLLDHGVEEILILPEHAPSPQRVLIHWTDESARHATLAVSASVLRHLSAEAIYVDVLPDQTHATVRSSGIRALLDARSEARTAHGLEIRTELRFGVAAQALAQRLDEAPGQMLILGTSGAGRLSGELAALLAQPRWPVLLVHREREAPAHSRSAA